MPRQRLASTSVVRYSAPVIGGTAAAILDNSPSAGIGTGGLLRSPIPGREHSAVTYRAPNFCQKDSVGGRVVPTSSAPRTNSPCPDPRANACSNRTPRSTSSTSAASASNERTSVSTPCGDRTGASITVKAASCIRLTREGLTYAPRRLTGNSDSAQETANAGNLLRRQHLHGD